MGSHAHAPAFTLQAIFMFPKCGTIIHNFIFFLLGINTLFGSILIIKCLEYGAV